MWHRAHPLCSKTNSRRNDLRHKLTRPPMRLYVHLYPASWLPSGMPSVSEVVWTLNLSTLAQKLSLVYMLEEPELQQRSASRQFSSRNQTSGN